MNSCSVMESCEDLEWVGVDISVTYADSDILERSEEQFSEFMDAIESSDYLIVNCHSIPEQFSGFSRLISVIERKKIGAFIHTSSSDYNSNMVRFSHLTDEQYKELNKYIVLGGEKNYIGMLLWLCKNLKGCSVKVPEPVRTLAQGIYHPKYQLIKDEEKYISSLSKDWPTVAILFQQRSWLENNTASVDALVRSFEFKGVQTIPIFFTAMEDEILASIGVEGLIKKYLMKNRKSIVDAVVMVSGFSQNAFAGTDSFSKSNIFAQLDVPIFQASTLPYERDVWVRGSGAESDKKSYYSLIQSEYDGQIITAPLNYTETDRNGHYRFNYSDDRVERITSMVLKWIKLRTTDPKNIRMAIVLNTSDIHGGTLGMAVGLDTFKSLRKIMVRLLKEGYDVGEVPDSSSELVKRLVNEHIGFSSQSSSEKRSEAVSKATYEMWFKELPEGRRKEMIDKWGEPSDCYLSSIQAIQIQGFVSGNVFIGIQPDLEGCRDVPSHHYYAFYRWMRDVFRSDAVIHLGSSGTLEKLSGRDAFLTSNCWPEILLGTTPLIYPYNMCLAGESTVVKRRTGAVLIGYAEPTMRSAGLYGELRDIEQLIQQHIQAEFAKNEAKVGEINARLCCAVRSSKILTDLGMSEDLSDSEIMEHRNDLLRYVQNLKNTRIYHGLHVFGSAPRMERLIESIMSIIECKGIHDVSLAKVIAVRRGFEFENLICNPDGMTDGRVNSEITDDIYEEEKEILSKFAEAGFDFDKCCQIIPGDARFASLAGLICKRIYPAIIGVRNEMDSLVHALKGGFIIPGPSGSITFDSLHVLPTGRNICSVDPKSIPNEISYIVGSGIAERMVQDYLDKNGRYPEQIALFVDLSGNMMSGGDQISCILRLLGVKPIWNSVNGYINGLEIIPLSELGRPRSDVILTVSPITINVFPEAIELVQSALEMILHLNEPEELNPFIRHVRESMDRYKSDGFNLEESRAISMMRIFSECNNNARKENSESTRMKKAAFDLGHIRGHGPAEDLLDMKDLYVDNMRNVDLTAMYVKDLLTADCISDTVVFAMKASGNLVDKTGIIDCNGIESVVREMAHVMRSMVLNPKWIDGMKDHGFSGAGELSRIAEGLLSWASKMDMAQDWMFEGVARRYVLDEEIRQWMMECNPLALNGITEYLYSAVEDGVWKATPDIIVKLREAFLETEDYIEESTDERL